MSCSSVVHGAGIDTSNCTKANNEGDYTFSGFAELKPASVGACSGLRLFLDSVDQGNDYTFYGDAYVKSTTCPDPHASTSKYDCINGLCTASANGFYSSLSECQVNCGKQGCSGQCISSADWAQIEGLSAQIRNKECG